MHVAWPSCAWLLFSFFHFLWAIHPIRPVVQNFIIGTSHNFTLYAKTPDIPGPYKQAQLYKIMQSLFYTLVVVGLDVPTLLTRSLNYFPRSVPRTPP